MSLPLCISIYKPIGGSEGRTVGGGASVAQADIPVTDEIGSRVVYIELTREMIKSVENKLDS